MGGNQINWDELMRVAQKLEAAGYEIEERDMRDGFISGKTGNPSNGRTIISGRMPNMTRWKFETDDLGIANTREELRSHVRREFERIGLEYVEIEVNFSVHRFYIKKRPSEWDGCG